MSLGEIADIIGIVRDVFFIILLLLAIVILFVVYRKGTSFLDSAKRTMNSVEEVADAISTKIAGPASAGSGVAFGAGKVVSFIRGFSKRKKREEGE